MSCSPIDAIWVALRNVFLSNSGKQRNKKIIPSKKHAEVGQGSREVVRNKVVTVFCVVSFSHKVLIREHAYTVCVSYWAMSVYYYLLFTTAWLVLKDTTVTWNKRCIEWQRVKRKQRLLNRPTLYLSIFLPSGPVVNFCSGEMAKPQKCVLHRMTSFPRQRAVCWSVLFCLFVDQHLGWNPWNTMQNVWMESFGRKQIS